MDASVKMSEAAVTSLPLTCSGDMNAAVPTFWPVTVIEVPSTVCTMPKSMTRAPSAARITLDGFRSRCTIPARQMASTARPRSAVSRQAASMPIGPRSSTASSSVGPGMYSVATHSRSSSLPLPISRTVCAPWTLASAPTSRWNRLRNCGSSAYSGRITLTAAGPGPPSVFRPR